MWDVSFLPEEIKTNERAEGKEVKIYFIAVYKFKHESSYSPILKAGKGPLAWH